jgi:nonribosomal peptide synthetase DhbF
MRSVGCGSWTVWKARARTYTIPLALRVRGELDRSALEAALGDLVERHESLRTIFPDTLGVPRQLILDAGAAVPRLAVTVVDEASLAGALSARCSTLRARCRVIRCSR